MKVVVGMSGGVDSTISAYLLQKQGYEVVGINLVFNEENDGVNEKLDAISQKLEIPIKTYNFIDEFKEKIVKYFVESYKKGITPNPCALCNGVMKFEKLLDIMKEEKADMMATGHYANVVRIDDRYCIKKSINMQKDQSYMLWNLTQEQLSKIIFPIGDMNKDEVRDIARVLELTVAEEKDSQDVCFIKEIDYKEFIKQYDFGSDYKNKIATGLLTEKDMIERPYLKKGEFVDIYGKVLGFHNGIINYTIGQRKGLNIAFGERKFVVDIDAVNNKVILGSNDDLFSDRYKISDINVQGIKECEIDGSVYIAKLRYRHNGTKCKIMKDNDGYSCVLEEPVRAITKGQSAVFYDENHMIMFGSIIK